MQYSSPFPLLPHDPFIGGSSDKLKESKQMSSLIYKNDFTVKLGSSNGSATKQCMIVPEDIKISIEV